MEPRLSLVTLGVVDLAQSRAFYRRLGWAESSSGNEHVAFFQCGGMALGLFGRAALAEDARVEGPGEGFANVTLAQNVATKAEVDRVLALALAAGAKLLKPAGDVFWGGYTAYFADPDGFAWEIAWNPHFTLAADGSLRLPV